MYGEEDPYYVTNVLDRASRFPIARIGNGEAKFQQTYVGNVAWAHVCALNALIDPELRKEASGKAYFVPDDTPVVNMFDFVEPFMKARGLSFLRYRIPYSVVYYLMWLLELFLWLLGPIYEVNLKTTLSSMIAVNTDAYFKRTKAEELLKYSPLYNYTESLSNSMKFYEKVDLK